MGKTKKTKPEAGNPTQNFKVERSNFYIAC